MIQPSDLNEPGARAATKPTTKTARQARIKDILSTSAVGSQLELVEMLADEGLHISQGTLSRDLLDVGAVRVRGQQGTGYVYRLLADGEDRTGVGITAGAGSVADAAGASSRLAQLCTQLLVSADANANMVVLQTPPGAANFLAQAIDQSALPSVMGTVAGDDTVLLITRESHEGADVAQHFLEMAGED